MFKVQMQSFNSPTLQWLFLLPFHRNTFLASIQTSCPAFPKWMSRPCQHLGLHPVPNHLGCPATLLRPPLWCPQPGCDSLLAILCRSTFWGRDTTFELFNVSIKNSWRHKQLRGEANSQLVRREEKYQMNKDKPKHKAKGCYQRNKEYLSDKKTGKGGMSNLQVFCIHTICPHTFSLKAIQSMKGKPQVISINSDCWKTLTISSNRFSYEAFLDCWHSIFLYFLTD